MSHRSRKRSFPHWEKKHRKRAEKLRAQVLRIYADGILAVMNQPDPLFDLVRTEVPKFSGRTIKFAVRPADGR